MGRGRQGAGKWEKRTVPNSKEDKKMKTKKLLALLLTLVMLAGMVPTVALAEGPTE